MLKATCNEGSKCREEVNYKIETEVSTIWENLLKTFLSEIRVAKSETNTVIRENWDSLVQCEIDNPCCDISETVYCNLQIEIWEIRKQLQELH